MRPRILRPSSRAVLRLAAGLLLSAGLADRAAGQVSIDITGGKVGALPIAVVPFASTSGGDTSISRVVEADLSRTGLFEALPRDNFISQPSRSEDVRYQNWRALGADYLIVGSSRGAGNGTSVKFELLDVYASEVLAGKRYTTQSGDLRTVAHTIANTVFEELTGRPGGFNSRLLYVRVSGDTEARQYELMYAQADGHDPQAILTSQAPILSPAWGPERERIAYVSFENDRPEVYVQQVASGKRRKVASYPGINGAPAFSPDGDKLAVTLSRDGSADIYVIDLGSEDVRRLTRAPAIDTEPVWAPNGESIYFTSDRAGNPQIFQIPIAGGSGDIERVTFEGRYNASPDLSPNGKLLATAQRGSSGGFSIAVTDLERDLTRVLTDGRLDESPSFSPSGAMLVYTRTRQGRTELATVSVRGRANQALRRFTAEVREPAWSPQ